VNALVLAAGRSSRLYPITRELPKCLLEVDGVKLIDRLWETFDHVGIRDRTVVTGFCREQIESHLGSSARFVHSPNYGGTNNLESLRLALEAGVSGPLICVHSDLLMDTQILERVIESPGDVVVATDRELVTETMKVAVSPGGHVRVGKDLDPREIVGTFPGIAGFSEKAIQCLVELVPQMDTALFKTAYFTAAFEDLQNSGIAITLAWITGLSWYEIDTAEDLAAARRRVASRYETLP
jgi:L-glutamine-phosphate cytidylyltransferase